MGTYEEYLDKGVDPATARAWADADAAGEGEGQLPPSEPETSNNIALQQYPGITAISPAAAASMGLGPTAAETLNGTLQDLRLRTGPAPGPAIGRDATEMVSLHVDENHTPVRLELRTEWAETLSPEMLPTAIFGAYRAALNIQYEEARSAARSQPPQPAATLQDLIGPLDDYRDAPRSLDRFREDVYSACDRADRLSAELASEAAARKDVASPPAPRTLAIQLDGPWLVGCEVNAAWAADAAAARIMNEFAAAVQQARDEQSAAGSPLEGEKQALLVELGNLTREGIAALQFMGGSTR